MLRATVQPNQASLLRIPTAVTLLLVFSVGVQLMHDVEHAWQVYEHSAKGLPAAESQGLLFFIPDLEWNHLVFAAVYLVALATLFAFLVRRDARTQLGTRWFGTMGLAYLAVGIGVQSYHAVEHIVRIVQFYQTGCTPCAGILGQRIDGVYLHFGFNMVVTILPAAMLIPLWPETRYAVTRAWRRLFGQPKPRASQS